MITGADIDEIGFNPLRKVMSMTFRIVLALSLVSFSGCVGTSTECSVLRLGLNERYVLKTWHSSSRFGINCPNGTAKELVVAGDQYSLYVLLPASIENPALFLGVESSSQRSFEIVGSHFRKNQPESVYKRASNFVQLNDVPDRIVTFKVVDRATGVATEYSWPIIGQTSCTCRGFAGP